MNNFIDDYHVAAQSAARRAGTLLIEMLDTSASEGEIAEGSCNRCGCCGSGCIKNLLLGEFPTHQFVGEEVSKDQRRIFR